MTPRLIVAGVTNLSDARMCLELGAHAVSFIFYNDPRQLTLEKACEISAGLPPLFPLVGEFADRPLEQVKTIQRNCRLSCVRLSGSENCDYFRRINCRIMKTVRLKPGEGIKYFDFPPLCYEFAIYYRTKNDGRRTHLWDEARKAMKARPESALSGSLNQGNLKQALSLSPYAVRVKSGAEQFIGKKDPEKIRSLLSMIDRIKSRNS